MVQKARVHFTRAMLVLVLCLGVASILTLINEPLQMDAEEFKISEPSFQGSRSLASVVETAQKAPTVQDVFEVACDLENQIIETVQTRIRFKGDHCHPSDSGEQIKNASNGFVATVFKRGESGYTTDYINLNEGSNSIEIKFGDKEKTVSVVRKPASQP